MCLRHVTNGVSNTRVGGADDKSHDSVSFPGLVELVKRNAISVPHCDKAVSGNSAGR